MDTLFRFEVNGTMVTVLYKTGTISDSLKLYFDYFLLLILFAEFS